MNGHWKVYDYFWTENDHFRYIMFEMIRKWPFSDQKSQFYWNLFTEINNFYINFLKSIIY